MSSKITEELRDSLVRCVRAGLLNTVSYAALNAIADRIDEEHERCKEEKAKLRESVRNLLTCIKHEECEESCPYYNPAYDTYGYERHGSIVVEDEYLGCCLVGLENCNSTSFDTDEYLRELEAEVES